MFDFCETPEKLKIFLEDIIRAREQTLMKFDKARAEGSLSYFSQWHGIDLIVQNVCAHHAESALEMLANPPETWTKDIPVWWYNALRIHSEQRITAEMRISSRSTMLSSNLCDDAERSFNIDLYRATHQAL